MKSSIGSLQRVIVMDAISEDLRKLAKSANVELVLFASVEEAGGLIVMYGPCASFNVCASVSSRRDAMSPCPIDLQRRLMCIRFAIPVAAQGCR